MRFVLFYIFFFYKIKSVKIQLKINYFHRCDINNFRSPFKLYSNLLKVKTNFSGTINTNYTRTPDIFRFSKKKNDIWYNIPIKAG